MYSGEGNYRGYYDANGIINQVPPEEDLIETSMSNSASTISVEAVLISRIRESKRRRELEYSDVSSSEEEEDESGNSSSLILLGTNRMHKLERGASRAHAIRLSDTSSSFHPTQIVEFGDKTRLLTKPLDGSRKRVKVNSDDGELHIVDTKDSDQDAYANVKVNDLFSPIESPFDVIQRPCNKLIFKQQYLTRIIDGTMAIIEEESHFNRIFRRFASILQGDDSRIGPHENLAVLPNAILPPLGVQDKPQSFPEMIFGSQDNNIDNDDDKNGKEDIDEEAQKAKLESVRQNVVDILNESNEFIARLVEARQRMTYANRQRSLVYEKLKALAKEEKRMEMRILMAGR